MTRDQREICLRNPRGGDELEVREFYLKELRRHYPAEPLIPWEELQPWMRASWREEFRGR
jgi:hypothetical protein